MQYNKHECTSGNDNAPVVHYTTLQECRYRGIYIGARTSINFQQVYIYSYSYKN